MQPVVVMLRSPPCANQTLANWLWIPSSVIQHRCWAQVTLVHRRTARVFSSAVSRN